MTLKQYSSDTWITEFLNIIEYALPPKYKTKAWVVRTKYGDTLGTIAWYSPWRKYAFRPAASCLFEPVCLRDIAQFTEERTHEHKHPPDVPAVADDSTTGADSGVGGGDPPEAAASGEADAAPGKQQPPNIGTD